MKAAVALLLLVATLGRVATAHGYCRATTCDPADAEQDCERDSVTQCLTSGEPLRWESNCLTVSVQSDGAPGPGIDYASAEASVKRAFAAWANVDCDGAPPSISVEVSAAVACSTSEYSPDRRNANIVMFREDSWPYEGAEDALGLTRVRFDLEDEPGALWDADIEINAVSEPLSVGKPQADEVDLDSLLTHEAGHVLGLAHSLDVSATMVEGYETGAISLRTPAADDIAGLCAIYPPNRTSGSSSCEPRHGFSGLCAADQPAEHVDPTEAASTTGESGGCGVARTSHRDRQPLFVGLALLVLLRARIFSVSRRAWRR